MGTGAGTGLNFGNTKGSQKEKEATEKDYMSELQASGAKFKKDDVVFVTKDKSGQLIWLEKGNNNSGLTHIVNRHAKDFQEKHGVSQGNIQSHLQNVFSKGDVKYERIVSKNGKSGIEKLYQYKGRYYLLSGVGTNGFIVSGYPIDKSTAIKLYKRYGK